MGAFSDGRPGAWTAFVQVEPSENRDDAGRRDRASIRLERVAAGCADAGWRSGAVRDLDLAGGSPGSFRVSASPYCCMVTVVGSLVMLSMTEPNPKTPDPDCTVILA